MPNTCTWKRYTCDESGEHYKTDCGHEWWGGEDDGALCEEIKWCPGCGKPVRPLRPSEDAPECPGCGTSEDMLFVDCDDGWECQGCDADCVPVTWIPERTET